MKPPYFYIAAHCDYPACGNRMFYVERKRIIKRNTGGQEYQITNVVCPACRTFAKIVSIKEVKTPIRVNQRNPCQKKIKKETPCA